MIRFGIRRIMLTELILLLDNCPILPTRYTSKAPIFYTLHTLPLLCSCQLYMPTLISNLHNAQTDDNHQTYDLVTTIADFPNLVHN